MKKSITKTTEPQKEIESNDPTKETVKKSIGRPPKETLKTETSSETSMMSLTDKIKELFPKPQITRVVLDDLREENLWLLDWLWNNQYQLIVASTDVPLLNRINSKMINLSGSLGRWRVITYPQALIEPTDCFIMYKALTNEQISQTKARQVLNTSDYKSC